MRNKIFIRLNQRNMIRIEIFIRSFFFFFTIAKIYSKNQDSTVPKGEYLASGFWDIPTRAGIFCISYRINTVPRGKHVEEEDKKKQHKEEKISQFIVENLSFMDHLENLSLSPFEYRNIDFKR